MVADCITRLPFHVEGVRFSDKNVQEKAGFDDQDTLILA